MTQAHKLACMHAIFLRAWTHISAKLCQLSKIKVSMESRDYFQHVWTYSRSCEGAGRPKRRPGASQRGQRSPNSPLQELERGAPQYSSWSKKSWNFIKSSFSRNLSNYMPGWLLTDCLKKTRPLAYMN